MSNKELQSVRETIRQIVNQVILEESKTTLIPKNFLEFRKMIGRALKRLGAPEDFVDEVDDVDSEGGGIPDALYRAWSSIELELRDLDGEDPVRVWKDLADFYVHDAVMDAIEEYQDIMNYSRGHKPKQMDDATLAQGTADILKGLLPH